jgi:hypothetical protein
MVTVDLHQGGRSGKKWVEMCKWMQVMEMR